MAYPYGNETPLTSGVNAITAALAGETAAYPYGNETPLTAGVNAVLAALAGEEASYPYGDETALTAGFNAVIDAIAAGGGGGGGFDWTKVRRLKFTLDNWQSSFSCDGMEEAPLTGCLEMFKDVTIPEIDITALDLTRATTLGSMFNGCAKLTSMTIKQQCPATNIANMFAHCQKIEAIDLSGLTGTLTSISSLCNSCYALKSIYMPNIKTAASVQISNAFYSCEALDAVIWATNSNSVQALGSVPGASFAPSNVIFYVPDALVADYKAATNWATIADRIKGVSELPTTYKTLYGIE